MKNTTKRICLSAILILLSITVNLNAQSRQKIQNGTILQCWCWSFKTIEENIPAIAEAGFAAVQTSPANTCLVGENGGMELLGSRGTGKWYYHYQPTDWKIGNYQLGTRDDFISMCKKAEEYGLGVIVDVLPNHTTPRTKKISAEFIEAVGGMEKLYHKNNDHGIKDYSNREECTTAKMGGLPDVNTENPLFQAYYMKYVNDLIECGADGFRYDTAKHIGLPDDPKDEYSPGNDFWPIFTGKKAINGVMLKNAEDLFIYGEVLQGGNSREDAYGEIFPVTASSYGGVLRGAVRINKLNVKTLLNWRHPAAPKNIVTWIESHDTYANQGESAKLTHAQLRAGWAVITARSGGTPLFFSRPQGPEATQFPGVSKIGDVGNSEFKHPEVAAVNKFRTAMHDLDETLINPKDDTGILIVKRGDKGAVIINVKQSGKAKITFELNLPDGVYKDKANKIRYSVKNGIVSVSVPSKKIAVIY